MSHSTDLRNRVLEYIEAGGLIKSACKVFKVSRSSIQRWRILREETGDVTPPSRERTPYKLDDTRLREFVSAHPDAHLDEMAEAFNVTSSGVWRALKRLNITRKKSRPSTSREMKQHAKHF